MMCIYCGGKKIPLYVIYNGKPVRLYGYVCRECGAFSPVYRRTRGTQITCGLAERVTQITKGGKQ